MEGKIKFEYDPGAGPLFTIGSGTKQKGFDLSSNPASSSTDAGFLTNAMKQLSLNLESVPKPGATTSTFSFSPSDVKFSFSSSSVLGSSKSPKKLPSVARGSGSANRKTRRKYISFAPPSQDPDQQGVIFFDDVLSVIFSFIFSSHTLTSWRYRTHRQSFSNEEQAKPSVSALLNETRTVKRADNNLDTHHFRTTLTLVCRQWNRAMKKLRQEIHFTSDTRNLNKDAATITVDAPKTITVTDAKELMQQWFSVLTPPESTSVEADQLPIASPSLKESLIISNPEASSVRIYFTIQSHTSVLHRTITKEDHTAPTTTTMPPATPALIPSVLRRLYAVYAYTPRIVPLASLPRLHELNMAHHLDRSILSFESDIIRMIRSISFVRCNLRDADLALVLSCVPNLEFMLLRNCAHLKHPKFSHEKLKELEISRCDVTSVDLKELSSLRTVVATRNHTATSLTIDNNSVTSLEVTYFDLVAQMSIRCHSLKTIKLAHCKLCKELDFHAPNAVQLTLEDISVPDACLNTYLSSGKYFSQLATLSLTSISTISDPRISIDSLTSVTLTAINLKSPRIDCTQVTSVKLDKVNCNDLVIHAPQLSKISFRDCVIRSPSVQSESLKKLNLSRQRRMTSADLDCRFLTELNISYCAEFQCDAWLSAAGSLAKLPSLKKLIMMAMGENFTTITRLQSDSLLELNLQSNNHLKSADIECPSLQFLNLNGCINLNKLKVACATLTKFHLVNAPKLAAPDFTGCPLLEELSLTKCAVTDEWVAKPNLALEHLRKLALSNNPELRTTSISFPSLHNLHIEECANIEKLVIRCSTLDTLELVQLPKLATFSIGECKTLCVLIIAYCPLVTSSTSNNNISNTGLESLAQLQTVHLSGCQGPVDPLLPPQISKLYLRSCASVETTKLVSICPSLEELYFIDSPIADSWVNIPTTPPQHQHLQQQQQSKQQEGIASLSAPGQEQQLEQHDDKKGVFSELQPSQPPPPPPPPPSEDGLTTATAPTTASDPAIDIKSMTILPPIPQQQQQQQHEEGVDPTTETSTSSFIEKLTKLSSLGLVKCPNIMEPRIVSDSLTRLVMLECEKLVQPLKHVRCPQLIKVDPPTLVPESQLKQAPPAPHAASESALAALIKTVNQSLIQTNTTATTTATTATTPSAAPQPLPATTNNDSQQPTITTTTTNAE